MTKLRHFDDWGTVRFVTFSCHRRLSILRDEVTCRIVLGELDFARRKYDFKLFGYVFMPEHVHLVLHPALGVKLGLAIGEFKSRSARAISAHLQAVRSQLFADLEVTKESRTSHAIWLPRFYDHNCRNQETVLEKINYCHFNPVKRGLVSRPEDWRWSSYRSYQGAADTVVELDAIL
jgi:putative transposase